MQLQYAATGVAAPRCTGPRRALGKARSAKNALKHGLRTEMAVLPCERPEDWQAHRDGIMSALDPAPGLESALAERVAFCLWRLQRVAAFETAATALGMAGEDASVPLPHANGAATRAQEDQLAGRLAQAEEQARYARDRLTVLDEEHQLLSGLPDLSDDTALPGADVWTIFDNLASIVFPPAFPTSVNMDDPIWLIALGVPDDHLKRPYEWSGWTGGLVRRGWHRIAGGWRMSPDELLARALQGVEQARSNFRQQIEQLGPTIRDLRQRIELRQRHRQQACLLPDEGTLNKVARYEAHVSRQLHQALHTLERLQAARVGLPVTPPVAVDVTVDIAAGDAPGTVGAA